MDVEQAIRDYLPDILHMSLATSVDNKPWVCEVHFVYDDDLNLYFRSLPSRRHSQEIAQNRAVAGNIVTQHGPGEKPRGLYFEGTAAVLNGVILDSPVFKLFSNRLNTSSEALTDALTEEGPKFYKITVSDWYVFDARESTPSQKYHWSPK